MGQLELRADQRNARAKNESSGEMYVFASNQIKCSRCGIVPKRQDSFFYKHPSIIYDVQNNRVGVCKDCMTKIYEDNLALYDDAYLAIQRWCAEFNYYYSQDAAEQLCENKNFSVGNYLRLLNASHKGKTFADSYQELKPKEQSAPKEISVARTSKWSIEDRKNRDNVINLVGFDPFADGGYTDEQLKFLYNTSAGYLTEAVEQDPHKLQSIIMMVKTFLQLDTVDRLINEQFASPTPDASIISTFTNMKDKLNSSIIKIANENGFSEKTSGKSMQGSNTLSARMQQMYNAHFELSKVNIHDVKMAESYREIAAMNAHALVNEMNLTGDDYARLCADQRAFVAELQETQEATEEENRLLRIRVKDLEKQIKATKK